MSGVSATSAANFEDDRRSRRQALVLRVALVTTADRAWFCLVKNISPFGLQAKVFGSLLQDTAVEVCIGDEDPIPGRVAWIKESLAGIEFNSAVDAETILRVAQKRSPKRRRSNPRVKAMARGLLSTDGRKYAVKLSDIGPSGARLHIGKISSLGPSVILTLPDLPPLKAFVRWNGGNELGLAFQTPLPIQIIAEWIDSRIRILA